MAATKGLMDATGPAEEPRQQLKARKLEKKQEAMEEICFERKISEISAASTHEADLDDVASREHFLRSQSSSSWRSVDSFHSASSSADFSRTPSAACIDVCVVY